MDKFECKYVCMCLYECKYVCIFLFVMYVSMYACMYVYLFVCMYAFMYYTYNVFMYLYVWAGLPNSPSTDHGGVASKGLSKFHRHVAQTSQPDNSELMVRFQPELIHGRVYGDAGAEERRWGRQVEVGGDLDHESPVYHDTLNIFTE